MIKTSSAKNKGRKLQVYIKNYILQEFSILGKGDVESCSTSSRGVDIKLSSLAREVFPVSVEAKKTKKHPSVSEMKQSQNNAYEDTIAAIIWCPHGYGESNSMITFKFEEFIKWYKELFRK